MLSCPRKTSIEWQAVLDKAHGDEVEAERIWIAEGWNDEHTGYNDPVTEENFDDVTQGEENKKETTVTDDFTNLIQRIKIYVNNQIDILSKKKITNQKFKQARLKEFKAALDTMDGVESISLFVGDAYTKALQAKKRFGNLIKNKKTMSHREVLFELTSISDFANSYSILDEIDSADIMNYFTESEGTEAIIGPITPQKALKEAISIRNKIKLKVVSEAIPYMARYLVEYKSSLQDATIVEEIDWMQKKIEEINASSMSDRKKAKELKKYELKLKLYNTFDVDADYIEKILKSATTDESALSFLMDPLIWSTDSALALFAKSVKSQFEFARQKDIIIRNDLVEAFSKYRTVAPSSSDNTEKFYDGMYEVVENPIYDTDGTIKSTVKVIEFVQKYDVNKFKLAERNMFKELGAMPVSVDKVPTKEEKVKIKAWWEARNKWYRENTVAKPQDEIDGIISKVQSDYSNGLMTEEEFNDWNRKNISEYKGVIVYKKELSNPTIKYVSSKWELMYDVNNVPKNEKGRFHAKLLDTYLKAQAKLPETQQKGFRAPSISKTDLERLLQNGFKDAIKNKVKAGVKFQSWDTEFKLGNLSEEEVKFLPIYYTQPMESKDVSLDFVSTILVFSAMANRYEAMNNVNSETTMMKAIIGDRKVPVVNSKGQAVLDVFAKKLGYEEYVRQNGTDSNSKKHLNEFINMVIMGEMQKKEEIFAGLSFTKITNSAMSLAAITSLSADLLKGTANWLQANIQLIIEASGGQFFNHKNVRRGKSFFAKKIGGVFNDFGNPAPTSLLGKLVEKYDAIQGNFKDQYGKKVGMGKLNKLIRIDTMFFNMHFGEYEAQVTSMLALFDSIKVVDKTNDKEITLLEAYNLYGDVEAHDKIKIAKTDSKGQIMTDDAGNTLYIPFGEKTRQDIQARLHGLNKYMNGVYNDFDKGTLQKSSAGRLLTMYRKHVIPGYKRRIKIVSMNHEIGAPVEGFYRTFADVMISDMRQYKFNVIKNWSTYTPFQKAQIKKVLAEFSVIFALATISFVFTRLLVDPDDDDREKIQDNYMYNFLLYEAIRMRSETASYINPIDALRVLRSPSAMTSTIDRIIKFMNQSLPWNVTETYKRDTGVFNKGDNKAWAAFLKLMGFSGYNTNPEEAWKVFESSFFK